MRPWSGPAAGGMASLAAGSFAVGMDAYVMAGLLAGIGGDLHVSIAAAGQSVTAYTLCYAVAAPLFATAFGSGRARRVLTAALVVFTAANLLSAAAGSFWLLIAGRALAGVGAGLFTPAAATTAAALMPAARRGRALGVVLTGMCAGTVVGVPTGLLLAGGFGWRAALVLAAALGALALLGLSLLLPDVRESSGPSLRARLACLAERDVVRIVVVTLAQTVASLGLYTYLQPLLRQTAHVADPALYLWLWGLGGVCGSMLAGPLTDRVGRPALLSGVLVGLLAVATALIPWCARVPGLVAVPLVLWGAVGWGFVVPQQHRLLAVASSGGAAVALNSSVTYLGSAVGSALGGLALASGLHVSALAPLAAAVALLGALFQVVSLVTAGRAGAPLTEG
nr:MFS transporter [Microbispora rosea]